MPDNKFTQEDKERVMSTQATAGKDMGAGGFAAKAQSAADKNDPPETKSHGQHGDAPAGKK
ncbi:hypothetical protein HDK77DRAFT_478282 [Phyllosticta capitalensis]|uniref:Seed maturation protein n=1 Tax=Phyllosticta capitalensis TaxID=121624 RepID=A0ABR1YY67_9PEZI